MEENVESGPRELLAGKFASVDALVHAYEELEAEFTRRSQKLKALEGATPARSPSDGEDRAAQEAETPPIVQRGVNLLDGVGKGVVAPAHSPKSIREAGALALGYFKKTNG